MPLAAPLQSHVMQADSAFITNASSAALNWREVLVEHVVLRSSELYVPRLDDHLICMVLDRDYGLEQKRNGQTFRHTFQPGQAQVLPMETSGWWRSDKDVHLLHLQFTHDFIQHVAAEVTPHDPALVELHDHFLIEDAQLQHLGLTLLRELEEGGSSGHLFSGALATAIATRLLTKYGSVKPRALPEHGGGLSRAALRRVLDYIHDHLAEDISAASLAAQLHLSVSHFNAVFKASVGAAPYQYVLMQRVERARQLLLEGDLSPAQAAAAVGFYDQSHLTRHMSRLLGVTPAALQRQRILQSQR
ncbi:MAG: AraC family transcriptional regulator [bacterium]|nr:AraC family transcriptional regulator [bacterium]